MKVNQQIEKVRDGIIEVVAQSISSYGYNATLGRLFGLLYFSDEPMSLDQMASELMVSKATVSINIRLLESFKFVQKTWKKGSRKDYYIAERDFDKIVQEALRTEVNQLTIFKRTLEDSLKEYERIIKTGLDEETRKHVESDIEKVYVLGNWLMIGERWLNFLLNKDLTDHPDESLKRIEVEWGDD